MKKVLIIAAAAVAAAIAGNKLKQSQHEQALWAEATNRVHPA